MKRVSISMLALCLAAPCSASAQLQSEARTDVISGRVTDLNGRPVSDALVGATDAGTGLTRTFKTDADGRYRIYFPGTPSQYSLQVKRMGFAPVQRTITRHTPDAEHMIVDMQLGGTPLALSMVEINGNTDTPLPREAEKHSLDATVPNPISIILGMKDTLHLSAVQIVRLGDLSDSLQSKNSRIYKNIRTLLAKSQEEGDATLMAGSVAMMLEEASRNTTAALVAAGKLLRPEQWAILPVDIRDREIDKSANQ
ncbi:MAG TPA: carboxypeptidase-like regulatory domain-containing protein [Gemmatimonadaceae bacterium]|nr:carboxypeptidase-like regulatory domain-containing protein [Gemmatimonadaceae bacterium]